MYNKTMRSNICGIILKVSYPTLEDTSSIEILGKPMLDWVSFALGESYCGSVVNSDGLPLPVLVRPYLIKESEYTVVLYSDTPLITRKTVLDAVTALKQNDLNALKMTRGYVFRTQYLLSIDKLPPISPYYFDEEDFMTAFNYKQIGMLTDALKNRIISYHLNNGVHFQDPSTTTIGCDVIIGKGVTIGSFNVIRGKTVIKDKARIGDRNTIDGSVIDEGASIESSYVLSGVIGKHSKIGPFAYIRPGTVVGDDCRVGDFVEIKASRLGSGVKAAHHAYIGDASVGDDVNIGCGVVVANYDGKTKNRTIIGEKSFVGSNCNLVAPIHIGDDSFIAAGSTVTEDVPPSSFVIARERQTTKPRKDK